MSTNEIWQTPDFGAGMPQYQGPRYQQNPYQTFDPYQAGNYQTNPYQTMDPYQAQLYQGGLPQAATSADYVNDLSSGLGIQAPVDTRDAAYASMNSRIADAINMAGGRSQDQMAVAGDIFTNTAPSIEAMYAGQQADFDRARMGLAQNYAGMGLQDAQFGASLGQADRQFGYGAGMDDYQFGAGLDQQDRQFAGSLNQQDRQFGYGAGLDDYQFGAGMDFQDRQFGTVFDAGQMQQEFDQNQMAPWEFDAMMRLEGGKGAARRLTAGDPAAYGYNPYADSQAGFAANQVAMGLPTMDQIRNSQLAAYYGY